MEPDVISYPPLHCERREAKLEPEVKLEPDVILSYPPLHCEKWEAQLEPELVRNNAGNSVCDTDELGQQAQRGKAKGQAARTPSCEKWEVKLEPDVINSYAVPPGVGRVLSHSAEISSCENSVIVGPWQVLRYSAGIGSCENQGSGSRLCCRRGRTRQSMLQCRDQLVREHF